MVLSHDAAETRRGPVAFRRKLKGHVPDGIPLRFRVTGAFNDDLDGMGLGGIQSGFEVDEILTHGGPRTVAIDRLSIFPIQINIRLSAFRGTQGAPVDVRSGEMKLHAVTGRAALPQAAFVILLGVGFFPPATGVLHFRAGRADHLGPAGKNGIRGFGIRLETKTGRPLVHLHRCIQQGDIEVLVGVVGKEGVETKPVIACFDIVAGGIEKFHEPVHALREMPPHPVLLRKVRAGADDHPVHVVGGGRPPGILVVG